MRLKIPNRLILLFGALLALAGAKLKQINGFGSDLPLGDQWYGEVTCTYGPWVSGKFGFTELFAAHNEHRIVFTRLLDLGLLILNGQWDPKMQLMVNTFVILAALAFLLWETTPTLSPSLRGLTSALGVWLFGATALWENTLNGFQSQFYFLLLFSLLHVFLTVDARPFTGRWWLGSIAGLCNLFTLAPGLLSASAVIGWVAWRRYRCKEHVPGDFYTVCWNFALLLAGWVMLPAASFSTGLAPPSSLELSQVFLTMLSWPVERWQLGLFVWAPALSFICLSVLLKPVQNSRGRLVALVLLCLLFMLATAVGRGGLASRYTDIFSLGLFANWLCLATWPAIGKGRIVLAAFSALWLGTILYELQERNRTSLGTIYEGAMDSQKRTAILRQYFASGNTALLRSQQFSELDISVLESIRTSSSLRDILPFSIRFPLDVRVSAGPKGFRSNDFPTLPNAIPAVPFWGTWSASPEDTLGEWSSMPLQSESPLLALMVAGELRPPSTEVFLRATDGTIVLPLQSNTSATDRWRQVNFRNPGRPFQIIAHDTSSEYALAFSAPLELARGSWFMRKALRFDSLLFVLGWALLLSQILVSFWTEIITKGSVQRPIMGVVDRRTR